MKIRFLMMALLGLGLQQASAQFYIGPRAGLNLANMSTDAAGTVNSMKIGIHGGLTSKWKFAKQLSVTGDALFSQQGTISVLSVAGTDGKIVMETETAATFNYVSVPVMLNLEVPIKSSKRVPYRMGGSFASWNLYGGGFFGYALSASNTITTTDYAVNPPSVTSTNGALESTKYSAVDFGIAVGTGFTFEMDPRNFLSVDARYMMGMADVEPAATVKNTNSVIGISLAYTYRLTKRNIRR